MIQKDQIVAGLFHQLNGLKTTVRCIDLNLCLLKKVHKDLQIHGDVIHHQDTGRGSDKLLMVVLLLAGLLIGSGIVPDGLPVHHLLHQIKGKGGTLSVDAFHIQLRTHKEQKALNNGHAKAGALDVPVLLLFNTLKGLEELIHILLADAGTGIGDGDRQDDVALVLKLSVAENHGDTALAGILYRIGQDVGNALADPHLIAVEHKRNLRIHVHLQLKALGSGTACGHIHKVVNQRSKVVFHRKDLQLTGFDLGGIEKTVDQG